MTKLLNEQNSFPQMDGGPSEPLENPLQSIPDEEFMFCPRYVSPWCMSRLKRCFDLGLSVIALILFSPLMLLIACLIKLTSKGPALFRQERIGLHQQTFTILKFRTMRSTRGRSDVGLTVTRHGDPRMTKAGAFLRRMKLDELPQLINVLRGEMSFVGPRPKIREHESLCMLCRPGITGAATIEFSQEEGLLKDVPEEIVERYVTTVLNPEKCKLDVQYMETTRFSTDLLILMHTIFKLSNRSKPTMSTDLARFFVARASLEKSSAVPATDMESIDFSAQDVRQSA
jgi:lipopolysaccharide/colanic/teichoic acid biosynthesis glycosyltransferase